MLALAATAAAVESAVVGSLVCAQAPRASATKLAAASPPRRRVVSDLACLLPFSGPWPWCRSARVAATRNHRIEMGRASERERACQDLNILWGARPLQKKSKKLSKEQQ